MLARLYERIHNKRHDFLHKKSTYYSNLYYLIFLEHLKVATNLTKNHMLACTQKNPRLKLAYF
ncbi:MAG TPA: hypothetical protein VNI77_11470 [Nitrososphaera sp.]|nr:hypothetical protein [Nitrososphaera sp.]